MFFSSFLKKINKEYAKRMTAVAMAVLAVCSCSKSPVPEPEPVADYPGKTVLLYQAGHNNLYDCLNENIDSLMSGYIPEYYDETRGKGNALLVYRNNYSKPLLIRMYSRDGVVICDTLVRYQTMDDACDTAVMREVLETVFNRFPAKEKGVIFSSHGTGWLPPMASVAEDGYAGVGGNCVSLSTFGVDDRKNHEMEIYELRDAIPFKMDYIIFDCCFMGGVETMYELSNKAEYIISSSAEILSDGFPYSKMMSHLLNATTVANWKAADLRGVAEEYYRNYAEKKSDVSRSATISLVRTSGMDGLAKAVKTILDGGGREVMASLPLDEDGKSIDEKTIQRLFRRNTSPYYHYYYDIKNLMDSVCVDAELLKAFDDALTSTVEYQAATPWFFKGSDTGFEIRTFCGITMNIPYPPVAKMDAYYNKLGWNVAAQVIPTE